MKGKKRSFLFVGLLMFSLLPLSHIEAVEVIEFELIEPFYSEATVEELVELLPESADINDPYLHLINRDNRLEADLQMEFAVTGSGHYYDASITDAFHALITAGEEHAEFMYEHGITLEEYIALIQLREEKQAE